MDKIPNNRLAFVWFTYELDHAILLRSVKAVNALFPGAKKFVADDISENRTLPKRVVRALVQMGCSFIPTQTPRRGNLRGWKCARMIAFTYKMIFDTEDVDALIKLDSDALLLSRDHIDTFLDNDTYRYGGMKSRCGRSVCGPTYFIKRDAAEHLYESYLNDMESPYLTEEDFEFASRLCRAYKGNNSVILQIPYSFQGVAPESADAKAGMYVFSKGKEKWERFIAKHWYEVVLGYPTEKYSGKSKEEAKAFILKNNKEKAKVMKSIWAVAHGR